MTTGELTEDLVTQMKELVAHEETSLWAQGDRLAEAHLGDAALGKLAQILQRKVATLRERERVAREFPPHTRDSRHSWTVYKVLTRIPNPEERAKLLNARTEWTVEAMETQVREWVRREAERQGIVPGGHLGRSKSRSGMRIGNIRVVGELVGDQLKITIETATDDAKLVDFPGELILACTVN